MPEIILGSDRYTVSLALREEFNNLDRWTALEDHGHWSVQAGALTGEWRSNSPSLFLKEKIHGDYLWQVDVTRVKPSDEFIQRFKATKWGAGADPEKMYNFNFWLRADDPDGGDFFKQYQNKLGGGWNGMGDDYWHSYFNTVVCDAKENRVRLRRSPGYELAQDIHSIVPFMPYGAKHRFTFVIRSGRVRAYCDETRIYDYNDPKPYQSGYIGVCVWLAVVRFEAMCVYRF